MSLYLSWSIEGEKQLSRNLLIMSERMKDWSPAFKETASYLYKTFAQDVFATEGGTVQEHWSPLSKAYALEKRKVWGNKGILEASGKMKESFKTIWRPDMASIWNDIAYFKYHQSNQPRSRLPRRVMMKLGSYQQQEIVRIFNKAFQVAMHSL